MRDGMQLSWEKWLAEARLLVCSCWGFTLQILGGSEVLAVFVLSEEVVYVPAPRRREAKDATKTFQSIIIHRSTGTATTGKEHWNLMQLFPPTQEKTWSQFCWVHCGKCCSPDTCLFSGTGAHRSTEGGSLVSYATKHCNPQWLCLSWRCISIF